MISAATKAQKLVTRFHSDRLFISGSNSAGPRPGIEDTIQGHRWLKGCASLGAPVDVHGRYGSVPVDAHNRRQS